MTAREMTSREPGVLGVADGDSPADGPFRRLIAGDWLLPAGVPGLPGFTPKFETVLATLQAVLTSADPSGSPGPSWYPPVVPRAHIDRARYTEAFPHLLGTVHALAAHPPEDGPVEDSAWVPTDAVLAPAVCYSVYPRLADRVIEQACHFDVAGYCYRHEATSEPGRFRSFRMREFVVIAGEDAALDWRESWIARCAELFARLGLTISVQSASDPFFGPGGRFMRSRQVQQQLKYEFVAPVYEDDPGTAIASANCHKDHLGQRFGIRSGQRDPAHSSCMAFGLERTVLALIHAHGDRLTDWPELL
jgi:seryl-tRNA synthetase